MIEAARLQSRFGERLTLTGPDLELLAERLIALEMRMPERVTVDEVAQTVAPGWDVRALLGTARRTVSIAWPDRGVTFERLDLVRLAHDNEPARVADVLARLRDLPFTVAVGGPHYTVWGFGGSALPYQGPSVPPHGWLGWMIAFKGEGHRQLLSRRWLQWAPARVIEQGDLTLVQFHDLDVDAKQALEQAKPGHEWLARGFLDPRTRPGISGNLLYSPKERSARIVVDGRDPSERELDVACWLRSFRGEADGGAIDRMIYVFIEPERARRALHALWLRECECWTFVDGAEVRLDADYAPEPPPRPAWVQRLDAAGP